jgi:hypothetical protein
MRPAIGFSILWRANSDQLNRADITLSKALAPFPHLYKHTIKIGETILVIWGRGNFQDCSHYLSDGSVVTVIGSPVGQFSWKKVEDIFNNLERKEDFLIPWDGRVIFLHVSSDGSRWTVWNDWAGSIPVFYTVTHNQRIASTLEPVVVAVNNFGEDDIFLPALLMLFTHGNFMAEWTLFKRMYTIRKDSVNIFEGLNIQTMNRNTIRATNDRWEYSWEDLVNEMNFLAHKAICKVFETQNEWIVPLSSGLDSRLIAIIGAQAGYNIRTYTWGADNSQDCIYARQIAKKLDLPWQRIDLGRHYLHQCLPVWVNLFGSAMHFHGMYQIPFYEALNVTSDASLVFGFLGDDLGGSGIHYWLKIFCSGQRFYQLQTSDWLHWQIDDLKSLFRIPIDVALEEIADKIETEMNAVDGPWFQKIRFNDIWGRQNQFTYYQSMLGDYYRGVGTPYINREYANFCFSLPRALLDNRRLQIGMMRWFYPTVMAIGGTYAPDPALLTGRYILRRRISKMLPVSIANLLLPEFEKNRISKTEIASFRTCKEKALWPIPDTRTNLSEWINLEMVDNAIESGLNGDIKSIRKIQSIQTFAYRLAQHSKEV